MKTKHVESLEEMVFRNKNKLYGAYALRKKYSKYLTFSLIFAFITLLSGLAYPVIASYLIKHTGANLEDKTITGTILPPPAPDLPPLPPPAPPAVSKITPFISPKIIDDSVDSDYGKQALLVEKKSLPIDNENNNVEPILSKPEPIIVQNIKPEPLVAVQEMPSFKGGLEALLSFLQNNIKYPQEAIELGISGTVYVAFVVEIDGSITEVNLGRGIGGGCNEEAIRVVKSMPNWIPGKQNNIPVRVRFNLPVKFILH